MENSKSHTLEIDFSCHAGQLESLEGMMNSNADIFTLDCARGWGKSLFVTAKLVLPLMLKYPNTQVQWVAPTYKICKAPIDDVWKGVDEITGKSFIPQFSKDGFQFWNFKKSDMEMHLFNDSVMYCRSADNPTSIVAKGYRLIIVDEAALIGEEVFLREILATARRRGCKIVLISTPRGKNWFYRMYQAGKDLSRPNYWSIKQPWWKRPDYPEILKRLMKDIPDHIRRQEFEAEFVGDGGSVFRNIEAVFHGTEITFDSQQQEWKPDLGRTAIEEETWVVSADLARDQDYTVVIAMGIESKRIGYYRRINKTDYRTILALIKWVSNRFGGADVIYDATGVGSGLSDFIDRDFNSLPFKFTNDSKNDLISRLLIGFETRQLEIPNILTIREEFEQFTYKLTRTGKMSYSAPDGKHDDIVIAIALAFWYAKENEGSGEIHEVDSFLDTVDSVYREKSELQRLLEEDD